MIYLGWPSLRLVLLTVIGKLVAGLQKLRRDERELNIQSSLKGKRMYKIQKLRKKNKTGN